MELIEVEKCLKESLESKNADVKKHYSDGLKEYFSNHKSTNEIVSIVVRGIEVDRAEIYYEYVKQAQKNDIPSIWKQVRENKEISENKNNNGLRFMCGFMRIALPKSSLLNNNLGGIITKIVSMITNDKNPIVQSIYEPILREYFLNHIVSLTVFPQYASIKITGNVGKKFAEILLDSISSDEEKYNNIFKWASGCKNLAEKQIEKEKIEAKIPKSKISDLCEIIEHYKVVEKQLHDDEYEIDRLEKVIAELQDQVNKFSLENKNLKSEVSTLKENIESQKKDMEKAEKEIDKRKAINDTFSALKKKDEEGFLNDIAEDLKLTYKQIKSSENKEMSVELGEIYRAMVKKVFKILDKKGIRME